MQTDDDNVDELADKYNEAESNDDGYHQNTVADFDDSVDSPVDDKNQEGCSIYGEWVGVRLVRESRRILNSYFNYNIS